MCAEDLRLKVQEKKVNTYIRLVGLRRKLKETRDLLDWDILGTNRIVTQAGAKGRSSDGGLRIFRTIEVVWQFCINRIQLLACFTWSILGILLVLPTSTRHLEDSGLLARRLCLLLAGVTPNDRHIFQHAMTVSGRLMYEQV